jgi:hypothetical protein
MEPVEWAVALGLPALVVIIAAGRLLAGRAFVRVFLALALLAGLVWLASTDFETAARLVLVALGLAAGAWLLWFLGSRLARTLPPRYRDLGAVFALAAALAWTCATSTDLLLPFGEILVLLSLRALYGLRRY